MSRYFIESVKCEVGEGGFACGPVSGPVVAEAKVKTDAGEEFFFGLAEAEGMPNFYKSDRSFYDFALSDFVEEDEDYEPYVNSIFESCEYSDIFEAHDPEWHDLFRYMIYIVRANWDECEKFMADTTGKYIDEVDIPMSDVEREDSVYEKLKAMKDEEREKFFSQLSDDAAEELLNTLLEELSGNDDITGEIYEGENCYFIIENGDITEISDDAGYNPRGRWFPDIVTGLPEDIQEKMSALIDKLGGYDFLEPVYRTLTDAMDNEFEDEEALELFQDDDEKLEICNQLMEAIKQADGWCKNISDFFSKFYRMDLEPGVLYYEWEGEFIDFLDNISDCGEPRGSYEELSAVEWIRVLCNLEEHKVTASEE